MDIVIFRKGSYNTMSISNLVIAKLRIVIIVLDYTHCFTVLLGD
jgi:hypothetical protein